MELSQVQFQGFCTLLLTLGACPTAARSERKRAPSPATKSHLTRGSWSARPPARSPPRSPAAVSPAAGGPAPGLVWGSWRAQAISFGPRGRSRDQRPAPAQALERRDPADPFLRAGLFARACEAARGSGGGNPDARLLRDLGGYVMVLKKAWPQ